MNLGPTGIRAKIESSNPDRFVVKYVFQGDLSPAKGKIHPGDIIIGANDKTFQKPHVFGRVGDKKGWYRPIMELSQHIEKKSEQRRYSKINCP